MKQIISLLSLFLCSFIVAQPNTDVFLFDLKAENGAFEISNMRNISNTEGYDNQPSFLDDNTILYAGTRNGQTDIVKYNTNYDSKIFINFTEGSEYSPLKIPRQNDVSAIRLEKDGTQKLYKYSLRNGESAVLIDDIVIGYHVWYNYKILVSAVLEDGGLSLYSTHMEDGAHYKLQKNIGRSLHKIPNTDLISYISKENDSVWEIKSMNPISGATKKITNTLPNTEDMCWLPDGRILMGKDDNLYTFQLKDSKGWTFVASLKEQGIKNITRLSVNIEGTKLALVGEGGTSTTTDTSTSTTGPTTSIINSDAAAIVQSHIEPYNNGDINFVNAFAENIVVSNFPNDVMYTGRDRMKENYSRFFKNNENLSVTVNKRIIHNNWVIDSELTTVNDAVNRQATIYKTGNGTIQTMTFIPNSKSDSNPELIVNKQLEAYNKRDINAFMNTYADSIKLYDFPDNILDDTKEKMRASYTSWFANAKDLNAKILQRIVIGNKVIDKEKVTANGNTFEAIAIYEVFDGKIAKVTFIR